MPTYEFEGGSLACRVAGEGSPVVALHASASTGAQWRSLVGYIAGRLRVFTPDLPGYGRSSPPGAGPGLGPDAAALGALIDRIGAPVHLVGHSWGGALALKLAATRPEAVRSLTVVEPVAFHLLRRAAGPETEAWEEFRALGGATLRQAAEGDAVGAMRGFIDYWNGAGAWDRTSPRLRGFFLRCLPRVLGDFRAILSERAGRDELAAIACPALAVMGLESRAASMRLTEWVARALPRGRLGLVPEAGHLAPLTDPHVVDPMIAAHLVAAEAAARRRGAIAA
jgi:pimeloyl-ACP methyl ester carboxylesterase